MKGTIMAEKAKLWDLSKELRVEIMSRLLWPLDFYPLARKVGTKGTLRNSRMVPKTRIPLIWKNDFTKIAKLYGCRFEFQYGVETSEYSAESNLLKENAKNTPLISIGLGDPDNKGNYFVSFAEIIELFCHELSHRIQHLFYGNDSDQIQDFGKKLSIQLEYEQEACNLAYSVYLGYFKHVQKIGKQVFRCYWRKDMKQMLAESWPDAEDDIGIRK